MNQVKLYQELLEKVFDQKIEFSKYNIENNCIGALEMKDKEDAVFRKNFENRLLRLKSFFSKKDELSEIIKTAKEIGQTTGYKWSGAYSELVALDYWTQFKDLRSFKYPDRGNVKEYPESIAKMLGKKTIDLDISFKLATCKINTDVKSLIPTYTELIDQILSKVKSQTKEKEHLIGIDNVYDVDFLETKSDIEIELISGQLISNLVDCINNEQQYCSYIFKSGRSASFRISYPKEGQNTVLGTTRVMDPYNLAANYKYKILKDYNKLLCEEPSLITFVINPWFNQELNTSIGDFFKTFLRSLSRRVFMELTKDLRKMENFFPKLKGSNIRISEVAQLISGIIFIKDESIKKLQTDPYDTYIFLNPNATNKVLDSTDFNILGWSGSKRFPFIDDFQNDNY